MDTKLRELRVLTRNCSKVVVDYLIRNYIDRSDKPKYKGDRCFICGASTNLTKEHVLPQWVYAGNPDRFFVTGMNGISQTYNKATVAACKNCNNNILSSLDKFVLGAIKRVDLRKEFFEPEEFEAIIRWLELIDNKFQVLNFRRRFLKHKNSMFIEYLRDFPVTMMRDGGKDDREVIAELRRSRSRIAVMNKFDRYNSLVVIRSKNPDLHFFHQMDDFIFIEFGPEKKAFFYFFRKSFDTIEDAEREAMTIVDQHY